VSEIWDSQEKLEAFGERLMPILAEVGIQPGDPEIYEVQNVDEIFKRILDDADFRNLVAD
jgi:hypothetical protein